MSDAKLSALAFLDTSHQRAGRPHPDVATETALINRDADFVLAYVEYAKTDDGTPGFFWYHIYRTGTDTFAEFLAKFGAPAK
jgi:hypothetical protein